MRFELLLDHSSIQLGHVEIPATFQHPWEHDGILEHVAKDQDASCKVQCRRGPSAAHHRPNQEGTNDLLLGHVVVEGQEPYFEGGLQFCMEDLQ